MVSTIAANPVGGKGPPCLRRRDRAQASAAFHVRIRRNRLQGIESDFRFWPVVEATAARHDGRFSREQLRGFGADVPNGGRGKDRNQMVRVRVRHS